MGERVIVRMNSRFEAEILAVDPHLPDSDQLHPVEGILQLTPYGMLLASLGACTAIVLHTYAQNHDVDLAEVELHLQYARVFSEDCEQCEEVDQYAEQIAEKIVLSGELTPQERHRLFLVSRHCPIHRMLSQGIEVTSRLEVPLETDQTAAA